MHRQNDGQVLASHWYPTTPVLGCDAPTCAVQDRFSGPSISEATLYSVAGESFIADQLSEVTKAHPQVCMRGMCARRGSWSQHTDYDLITT
jgi:hypothetical protein